VRLSAQCLSSKINCRCDGEKGAARGGGQRGSMHGARETSKIDFPRSTLDFAAGCDTVVALVLERSGRAMNKNEFLIFDLRFLIGYQERRVAAVGLFLTTNYTNHAIEFPE
jgi:hypothetical protein